MDETIESTARDVNRRDVLKLVGGTAVGLTMMTGAASARQFQFYGCSQVCSDSRGSRAVVAVDDGYECRPMPEYNSERQNQDWKWRSACYEAAEGESVVGIVGSCGGEDAPTLCVNPNNCASNYYESERDLLAAVNDLDCCDRTVVLGECDAAGTGRGSDERHRPRDEGSASGNGRGNKHGRGKRGNGNGRGR